ncbi:MAG TPA: PEP/pyruvate-binding domain-containing protein [Solirubrobacteraceae bacterium]|nr:PEP/pyruvate-binding domain-containing protein [Solirubrobacteraceae bacterium]
MISGADAQDPDELLVGGKAYGLARLVAAGARVPPFCVVPTAVFRAHLRSADLLADIGEAMLLLGDIPARRRSDPAALDEVSALLRCAVERAPLHEDLRAAIEAAVADLGPGPYAVRSSMVGEDSAEHSFAGQLRSELFQPTADDVVESVRRCWGSAFGAPALAYAARAGISPTDVHLAVVIQAMADAEVAGVAFSANPVTGARDECLVTAAYGLGEGVVADLAPADAYAWSPLAGERSATLADKHVQVVASSSGRGTEVRPVAQEARERRALTTEQVAEVGALATAIAAAAGMPMDVEWCFAGGDLYALQARPITSLPPALDASAATHIFDNSNIQESFNGVTTPLTFSFAARLYGGVYTASLRNLGASERTLDEFEPVARRLLALVDGRVFYNLASWRHLIETLPGGRKRVEEIETVMFHTTIGTTEDEQAPLAERLRRGAEIARMLRHVAAGLARQDAAVDRYVERFQRFYDGIDRASLPERSLDELGEMLRRFSTEVIAPAAPAYLNDVRMAMTSGRVRKLLASVYDDGEVDGRLADLLGGIDGLESVEPTRQLMGIARDARRDDVLASELQAIAPGEVVAQIRRRSPALAARIDAYVERYGDRTIGELKLETTSLRDDERFLGEVILNYLGHADVDPDRLLRAERERADTAMRDLCERVPAWRRRLLPHELALARKAVSCRERLRLRRTWAFALARDIYGAIGLRLHEAGVLEHPRDVLYLSVDEIDAFLEGRAISTSLAPVATARRVEYEAYARKRPPDRFETAGSPYLAPRRDLDLDDGASGEEGLRGLGCCAGIVEAPVRIIMDPSESLSINDEILCTMRTDPGWAPLFPTASGLIVERGSTLSHSAVVARELGIPTVVGVRGVTRILRDGERVRLDGGAGLIERLDPDGG